MSRLAMILELESDKVQYGDTVKLFAPAIYNVLFSKFNFLVALWHLVCGDCHLFFPVIVRVTDGH
jgi:hypothetical protein